MKFTYTILLILSCGVFALAQNKENTPDQRSKFIQELITKMTIEEKLGQLNLPTAGDITTGQANSSDVAKNIQQGKVGSLFNIKSVAKIKEVQKISVENSRL